MRSDAHANLGSLRDVLVLVLALGAASSLVGCASQTTTVTVTPDGYSSGNALTFTPAPASPSGKGSTPAAQPVVAVDVALSDGSVVATQEGEASACLTVALEDADGALVSDCPSAPGTYTLESLHAHVVDLDLRVAKVTGTLTVRAFALPCGDGACGKLDADLVVSSGASAASPRLLGRATLAYAETADVTKSGGGVNLGLGGGSSGGSGWTGWME